MSILDLEAFRKLRAEQSLKPKIVKDLSVTISNDHDKVIHEMTQRWHQYALQSKLDKMFCTDLKLPLSNYSENLTGILEVERNLRVRLAVMPSDFINNNLEPTADGRAAFFKFGIVLISTPLLSTEAHARMFAILLHQKLNHTHTFSRT